MALRNTFTTTPYKISKKWRKCEKVKYIQHIFLERTNIGPEPYLKKNSESSDNILPCIHYHLIHCRAQLQLPFYRFKSVRWKWRLWWRKCRYCWTAQKQPSRGVLKKSCSENMQQIFRRIPVPKCNFNKVGCNFIETALRHERSPVNLLHIFRTPFPKNTSGWLRLTAIYCNPFR